MKRLLLLSTIVPLFGCGNNANRKSLASQKRKELTREAYMDSLDSAELLNGFMSWISDTAYYTNVKLMSKNIKLL